MSSCGEGLELFRVFAQRQHGLALIFVADVCAVLQGIELGVLLGGGAARSGGMLGIAGARRRATAGVSWGDLRKDMVPPGTGC